MDNKLKAYFPLIREREEILLEIGENQTLSQQFCEWGREQQEEFLDSCTGVKGVKVLYDSFFREIMDPDVVPELLEEFLSLLLGHQVKVLGVLPNDSPRIADEKSLLIMDIVVELTDGSIANVEVQKIGYLFPGQRSACYSADLLLRQYRRVRGEKRKKFSYRDIKGVYTIVLFERSPGDFWDFPNSFIHVFGQKSDTGLEMELLQKYVFIPLDIFQKTKHNKTVNNKLEAWLMFFSADAPEDIIRLISKYPEFKVLYEKVYSICRNMERIMGIFSEELLELDRNTAQYMMDEMQSEIDRKREELKQKREELSQASKELSQKNEELSQASKELSQKNEELSQTSKELSQKNEELSQASKELSQKNEELSQKNEELSQASKELSQASKELSQTSKELSQKNEELDRKNAQLDKERHLRCLALIRQIRNFARKGLPESECADMLAVDVHIVGRVYGILEEYPDSGDTEVLDVLCPSIIVI